MAIQTIARVAFVILGIVQVVPGFQANSSPEPARAQQEDFLRTATVVKSRHIGKGVTDAFRTTIEKDGVRHDAQFQSIDISRRVFEPLVGPRELNFRDSYKFNIAAYEIGRLVGVDDLMAPVVERKLFGHTGALTWWIDDVMMDERRRLKAKLGAPDVENWNRQMQAIRVFDQLIYNTDRNAGNLLITKDWKVWMIDHTRAFRIDDNLRAPQNLTLCDRALLANMRALNNPLLKERVGRWLTGSEIHCLLARRDKILALFEAAAKQKGESAVLYDRVRQ